jgi:putative endonuclease
VYLKEQGYVILEKNFRCRMGEIDLIAREGSYLVFVEVKYRSNASLGDPLEAVDRRKQATIRKVASWYLMKKGLSDRVPCRFDVVGILGKEITLIRNAF